MAVKRVNELDFYNLGANQLAKKVDLTVPKAIAVVDYLNLRQDQECYKEFKVGEISHKRYSAKAIEKIKCALKEVDADEIWAKKRAEMKKRR